MKPILAVVLIAASAFSAPAVADYALVHNGRVAQVAKASFPVAPPLYWLEIPDGVRVAPEWTYNGMFIAPSAPIKKSEADEMERTILSDPRFKAIIRALAETQGKTESEIVQWLKSKL